MVLGVKAGAAIAYGANVVYQVSQAATEGTKGMLTQVPPAIGVPFAAIPPDFGGWARGALPCAFIVGLDR